MTILLLTISIIVPIISFIFEIYPRLLNRNVGVDIWTHLLYLQEYKAQGGIPKKITKGFLVSGEYDYPPAFITILSKFPMKYVEKYEFVFSPFFDSLHLIIIFFLSYFLSHSLLVALLTQILYMITPIIAIENSSATPRSLGYTLFTGVFFSLFYAISMNNIYLFLLAVVLGSFIFVSHRFTTQGFLFFALFFSIVDKNLLYIFCFILSFIGAMVISRGFYLKVLQGHLGNLKFWYKNIRYRFYHQIRGSSKEHKPTDFVFRVYNQFISVPPVVLAVTNPWVLMSLISLYFIKYSGLYFHLYLWVAFSYVLALLTIWVEKLRFLGEGQRYFELSAFPTAFLSALFLQQLLATPFRLVGIAGYGAIWIACLTTIVVIQRKAIIKDTLRTITPELSQMYTYLKKLKNKPRLLCIPHQITTNTIYHTGCPVFVNADYKNIDKISEVYPYLKIPIKEIMKKYELDAVLLNEEYASIADLKLKRIKELKRVRHFVLFKPL